MKSGILSRCVDIGIVGQIPLRIEQRRSGNEPIVARQPTELVAAAGQPALQAGERSRQASVVVGPLERCERSQLIVAVALCCVRQFVATVGRSPVRLFELPNAPGEFLDLCLGLGRVALRLTDSCGPVGDGLFELRDPLVRVFELLRPVRRFFNLRLGLG